MSQLTYDVETLIIGGGQAGLAMGQALGARSKSYLILEAGARIGDAWRHRYDSLRLFTTREYSALPGLRMTGDPDGCPTKDEVADYLEGYARHFRMPIRLNTPVLRLKQAGSGAGFLAETPDGPVTARQVVVATGAFQTPFVPEWADKLPAEEILQLHAAAYRNPSQLRNGNVLIVGGGNSGVQIAEELAADGREVHLSVGQPLKFLPTKILNRSLFKWLDLLGVSRVTIRSKTGQYFAANEQIIGTSIKPLLKSGEVVLRPRAIGFQDDSRGRGVVFADGSLFRPDHVIFATGYRPERGWLEIEGLFDRDGKLMHERGVTQVPGLSFIGLPWQNTRGSALLLGVGDDAKHLSEVQ